MRVVELTSIALDELDAACERCDQFKSGSGEELEFDFVKLQARLIAFPYAYAVSFKGMRRARIGRSRYAIFYCVRGERIIITAVFHESQDPNRLSARLPDLDS